MHMLWYCPKICSYWNSIYRLIAKLKSIISKPTLQQAILIIDIDKLPLDLRYITIHVLFATRLVLMCVWKYNATPNIGEVTKHLSETYTLEQIMAYKHGCLTKFYKHWSPLNALNGSKQRSTLKPMRVTLRGCFDPSEACMTLVCLQFCVLPMLPFYSFMHLF